MTIEAGSSGERAYDAASRIARIRNAQRVLRSAQHEMMAIFGRTLPEIDAAIRELDDGVTAIEQQCAGEPPGYDPRPDAAVVTELLSIEVALQSNDQAPREPENVQEDRPAYLDQGVRVVRELWKGIDVLVAADAPYVNRLQLHTADAAFHRQDHGPLREAHIILRGVGAAESDTADAIATVAAMCEDLCATLDAAAQGEAASAEEAALDAELVHYVRRAVSPYVEKLPSADEVRNFVANERAKSKRGRPRKGEDLSKRADRFEDIAALLSLDVHDPDSIRRAIDKHQKAVRDRVQARKSLK